MKEYLIHGNPINLPTLSYILLQLTSMASRGLKALTNGIRVFALLLTNVNRQQTADAIMASVKTQLDEYMETFATNVEMMHDMVEHIMVAAIEITNKMDDFKDGFQETAEQLTQAMQDFTKKTTENLTTMTTPHHTHQGATYASIVEEGVDVLEVPRIGCPVTTEEVSVKRRNNRNG